MNNYDNTINNLNNDINNYRNIISKKDIELNNYKSQLVNNTTNIPNNKVYFNDIICVNFISSDQNVHYAVSCLKSNTFAEIEEKLYKEYSQYMKQIIIFLQMEHNF